MNYKLLKRFFAISLLILPKVILAQNFYALPSCTGQEILTNGYLPADGSYHLSFNYLPNIASQNVTWNPINFTGLNTQAVQKGEWDYPVLATSVIQKNNCASGTNDEIGVLLNLQYDTYQVPPNGGPQYHYGADFGAQRHYPWTGNQGFAMQVALNVQDYVNYGGLDHGGQTSFSFFAKSKISGEVIQWIEIIFDPRIAIEGVNHVGNETWVSIFQSLNEAETVRNV